FLVFVSFNNCIILAFYYMNLVTLNRLKRNPTIKNEMKMREFSEESLLTGFLCYPISQAADITAFEATHVPVGEDQKPMIEQTREIVEAFNRVYGETLVLPGIVLPDDKSSNRLVGIDGNEKMSKSLNNAIFLSDDEKTLHDKVFSCYTDPNHLQVSDKGKVEGNVVFTYLDVFCTDDDFAKYLPDYKNLKEMKEHYERGGLGDVKCKKFLYEVLNAYLKPIRERRAEWEKRLPDVYDIIENGTKKAQEVTNRTLAKVKKAMVRDYLVDKDKIVKEWEGLFQ
ncbi:MAG: tryptophan--tRNA ligase, partial [Lachnospiraceae bacterium]|nr:tryptophan--tRNA ligase [Lachnospiraceae bacterium]